MTHDTPQVTVHMAASLDGFVARRDGRVDWMETSDHFQGGRAMSQELVQSFLDSIDCYVMGSRTYETALAFEAKGSGWAYGDKPTFVLTGRSLPRVRPTVDFYSGDLAKLFNERLKRTFQSIWVVGGPAVCSDCLRLGLADRLRYSVLPVLIGDGVPFFGNLSQDLALHLVESTTYDTGVVELCYEIERSDRRRGDA